MLIVSSETAISGPRKSDGIPVAERASGDLEQVDAAVGPLCDEAPECEFDILLGGFEHGAGNAAPLSTMASAALAMTQEPRRIDRAEAEPPPACTRSVSPVTSLTRSGSPPSQSAMTCAQLV